MCLAEMVLSLSEAAMSLRLGVIVHADLFLFDVGLTRHGGQCTSLAELVRDGPQISLKRTTSNCRH